MSAKILPNGVVRVSIACVLVFVLCAPGLSAAQETQAGFSRRDITPAIGAEIPGGFSKNISKGVHDPLWTEAAVFSNDGILVAIVGVDLVMVPDDIVAEARELLSEVSETSDGKIVHHTSNSSGERMFWHSGDFTP